MNEATIKALVIGLFAAACFAGGWLVEGWRKDAEIARIQRAHTQQTAADLQQHLDDLSAAEELGRQLVARLAAAETTRETLAQEKTDALRRLTTGRRCLDADAVRVLNDTGLKPASVPETARQPVSVDAAFATDTDVGVWIGQCQRGYETCRGRLAAIADFYKEEE